MPIELDNTSINVINSADTFQVDFVKSKGSYTVLVDFATFSCGRGNYGQLGHDDTSNKTTPTFIQYFVTNNITISQVSSGSSHSIFVDTNGNVYSCGYNYYGQLGHGDTSNKTTPTLIQYFATNNITISQVSSDGNHSIFLDTNGNVYSCGRSNYGQLGHGNTSNKSTPTKIQYFSNNISQVSAGGLHSIFLHTNGNVYSCGRSNYGQLGHGNSSNKSTPTLIQYFANNISQVSAGDNHSIFLHTNGNVYSCGRGSKGQLGHGATGTYYTPKLIQYFANNISQVSASGNHSIFLHTNGNVYSCGLANYGQLGHGNTSDKSTPTLIQYFATNNITISQVSSGSSHSIFLDTNGMFILVVVVIMDN